MKKNTYSIFILVFLLSGYLNAQTFKLVKDIQKGSNPSNPNEFKVFNGKLYFVADDGIHGIEPWVTDGTDTGTHLLKDIYAGIHGSQPTHFNYPGRYNFYEYNGKLFFCAKDSIYGSDLWISDGTSAGTKMLKEIDTANFTDPDEADIYFGGIVNGKLIFSAYNYTNGPEPWVTDGTDTGTYMLGDIDPGNDGSFPASFNLYNGKLYFCANNQNTAGYQLYVTNGTIAGTKQVTKVYNSSNGWGPDEMIVYNNKIYLTAHDPNVGRQLYTSDGTDTGTKMITKLDSSQYGFSPKHFFVYNGNLFFSAHDKIHGIELWSTDGTKNGEHILIDINPGKDSSMPDNFFIYNSKLYFTANDGTHGFELWVTNGTSAGIHIVKDLHKGNGDSYPHNLTLYNNQIYFVASDSANGTSLAHSDGSDTGTNILAPTFATMKYPLIDNHGIVPYNNTLYFNANYTILDNELWSFFDTSFHTNTSFVYIDKNIFRSYPNPLSANILNLEFQNIPGGELNINLISMDGKIMLNQKIATPDKYIQIELPAKISNGMYILQMSTEKDIHYQKIIVQH